MRLLVLLGLISLCYYPTLTLAGSSSNKDAEDDDASSSLFAAVREDDEAMILEALEKYNINTIGPGGQTPLMHAILMGKEKAVQVLLANGADTSIGEKDGYTPMHGAGFQGRAAIAKMLIQQAGLNPSDAHAGDGHTPIHRACWGREQRHADTVQVLLEIGGVSPFEPSRDNGKVPLDMTRNPATIQVLQEWIAKLEKESGGRAAMMDNAEL